MAPPPQNIQGTFINDGCILIASPNGKIFIGNDCMISYNVHIRTSYHNYIDGMNTIHSQGMGEATIRIGNDVWLGFGAQIMSGVTIGDGAVIGAGAIVCHDVEPYSVVTGVPAKRIKSRIRSGYPE